MSSVDTTSVVKKFPEYYCLQVHPENDALKVLSTIVTEFAELKLSMASMIPSLLPASKAGIDKMPLFQDELQEGCSLLEKLNYDITEKFVQTIQDNMAPIMPATETPGFYLAMCYIERELLTNPRIYYQPNEIIDIVRTINGCVSTKKPAELKSLPKVSYRDGLCAVWDFRVFPKVKEDFPKLDQFVLTKISKERVKYWQTARRKVWDQTFITSPKPITAVTAEEKEVMGCFAAFKPAANEIPHLMRRFATELAKRLPKQEDPISLAAWVHQELVAIHFSVDGNGRTARLVMNWILMLNGKKPLLIDNDIAYTEAVESKEPNAFENYLRSLEKHVPILPDFIVSCFRHLYETSCEDWEINRVVKLISRF